MRIVLNFILPVLTLAFALGHASGQTSNHYLRLVVDTARGGYGYINAKGDTVIPVGKYLVCYTEKFDRFAIVSSKEQGLVGIDKKENVLFNVYVFDNGPDYPSNGLFRIVREGKIGYANLKGEIVIQPVFDCAYPFVNGRAKVGKGCKTQTDGDHSWWTEGRWYTINKKGDVIKTNFRR